MKKFLFVFILSVVFSVTVAAQGTSNSSSKTDESKWSTMSYVNLPILKILEGRDCYVVLYQKNKVGVGKTVVPKAWAKGTPDNPRKLKLRKSPNSLGSYLTVIKKDGQFSRVIINTTLNKKDSVWGVADYHSTIEGSDKETLEELEL